MIRVDYDDRVSHSPPIVLILGPTAGGKTALSVELALRLPGGGECISADSMQVYRGMDIGTAKPAAAERRGVPHHGFDLVDPGDAGFTVDSWLAFAERTVAEIRGRGAWPIVVGGTNLYVKALLYGLFEGPEPDEALRQELAELPLAELRAELERIDPTAAQRIHANDRRRTIRAIEVHRLTGRPISDWQREWDAAEPRPDVLVIGLDWPAEAINRRINARVRRMMEAGLLDEVRRLHDANELGEQAREALGYKQVIDHLEGRCSLDEAVEQIKIRTRRFAKQQRTWFRHFRRLPRSRWIEAQDLAAQDIVDKSLAFISERADLDPVEIEGTDRSDRSE